MNQGTASAIENTSGRIVLIFPNLNDFWHHVVKSLTKIVHFAPVWTTFLLFIHFIFFLVFYIYFKHFFVSIRRVTKHDFCLRIVSRISMELNHRRFIQLTKTLFLIFEFFCSHLVHVSVGLQSLAYSRNRRLNSIILVFIDWR